MKAVHAISEGVLVSQFEVRALCAADRKEGETA